MPFIGPLEDRIAIQELNASCGDAVSRSDKVAFAITWAEDARWHLPWPEEAHSRTRIVESWLEQMNNYPQESFP